MHGHSHLTVARSKDGISNWEIDSEPTLMPDIQNFPEELWGIEDPRITYVPRIRAVYHLIYFLFAWWPGVSMAMTKDFRTFERLVL